jgi:Mn-dependent DtxR family transcriptional regulator
MLKRLEAEGLVERGEQKEAILTPSGIERAERVVREPAGRYSPIGKARK